MATQSLSHTDYNQKQNRESVKDAIWAKNKSMLHTAKCAENVFTSPLI